MLKVLIVEDDIYLNGLIRKCFRTANFIAYSVYNLKDTIDFLKQESADLIILDLSLPDGYGWEILDLVRAGLVNTPSEIIIITGHDIDILPLYLREYHILQKPLSMKTLLSSALSMRYLKGV